MAIFITLNCGECGGQVANHEKAKRYVHVGMAPEREPHRPVNITNTKRAEVTA